MSAIESENRREYSSDVAFTPAVKAIQQRKGSRKNYQRMVQSGGWETTITPELAEFLADLDMFYLATANAKGSRTCSIAAARRGFSRFSTSIHSASPTSPATGNT